MTIIFVIIGLSVLILGHEAGHFFAAKAMGLRVDEFGFGFPPRIFAWRPKRKIKEGNGAFRQAEGDIEYSINWLPFGGFVKIAGENDRIGGGIEKLNALPEEDKKKVFIFQPAWKRSIIILAGVAMNFVIAWVLFSASFMTGTPKAVFVGGVQESSPAYSVGIASGDIIRNFTDVGEFIDYVNENRGKEITVSVLRGSEEIDFNVVPRVETGPDEGALGVSLSQVGVSPEGFFSSIVSGAKQTYFVSLATIEGFYMMLKNLVIRGSIPSEVAGPVGIFSMANQVGKVGVFYLVSLIALISVNLAILNLIPFPALDGGRFLFIVIEKIKGSPIPVKTEAIVNGVGFALLILLLIVVTVRDVAKILG